jgi:hypothetical protein
MSTSGLSNASTMPVFNVATTSRPPRVIYSDSISQSPPDASSEITIILRPDQTYKPTSDKDFVAQHIRTAEGLIANFAKILGLQGNDSAPRLNETVSPDAPKLQIVDPEALADARAFADDVVNRLKNALGSHFQVEGEIFKKLDTGGYDFGDFRVNASFGTIVGGIDSKTGPYMSGENTSIDDYVRFIIPEHLDIMPYKDNFLDMLKSKKRVDIIA